MKKYWAIMLIVLTLVATGCSSKAANKDQPTSQSQTAGAQSQPDAAKSQPEAAKSEKTRVGIAGGNAGGAYYLIGVGMAELINKYVPGVQAVSQTTGGAVENARLTNSGQTVIGQIPTYTMAQAMKGSKPFEKGLDKIMIMTPGYPAMLQVVVREDSKIKTFADLKGKKVSMGPAGGGTETVMLEALDAIGMDPNSFKRENLSFNGQAEALKDRVIDAAVYTGGMTKETANTALADLEASIKIHLLPLDDASINRISEKYPSYSKMVMKQDVLPKTLKEPLNSIGYPNMAVANADASPDFIYQVVKVLFEHSKEFIAYHPAAAFNVDPEGIKIIKKFPIHPGAQKYYKERGWLQ